jgi:hypothetical protein
MILTECLSDLSGCLANCSNQGVCIKNSLQQYACQCNQFRTDASCQTDSRPCSSNPCLNNGTCFNMNNNTSFYCTCQNPELYHGIYCENKNDLCKKNNNTEICYNSQGYCIMNGTQPMCKCLMGFSGTKCELTSNALVMRNAIINASTIIAITFLVCFIIIILVFDYTKYFLIRNQKPIKKEQKITKFKYHP